ncbi:MAG: 4Fe-4S binding protein [Desulfopila sp.]
MGLRHLKRLRVGLSLAFFVATTLLFLDFGNWFATEVGRVVLYPQFAPALLQFLHAASLAATGFAVVLLVTILCGRLYCSTICPLGTLQDLAGRLFRRRNRRSGGWRPPHTVLRYSILAATLLSFLAGSNLLVVFLDPFSIFGRIVTNIVRPIGIAVNNGGAMLLERFGLYTLVREHWAALTSVSVGVTAATLLVVTWLATHHGRLYCNTICPVGTLLGLVARFSLFKLQVVDALSCTDCGRCAAACKAGCIDLVSKRVDMSRCVGCYTCLSRCPTSALGFAARSRFPLGSTRRTIDLKKRELLVHSGGYLLALSGLTSQATGGDQPRKIIQAKPTTIPVIRTSPVSPPGSLGIDHFTSTCTACHLCVSACPPQILLPALLEYGLAGVMQPRMHFQTGHCTYECTICGEVCPTGAIQPLGVERKKLTQTGIARFIKENCVVFTDNTACGACSEHCPTKAVNMVPYANPLGKPLVIPEVKTEICVGCGGCEHACPTRPYKAIFVDGNPLHKLARKPVVEAIEQDVDYKEDFPF